MKIVDNLAQIYGELEGQFDDCSGDFPDIQVLDLHCG